ncbi:MAG: helix-turn-helix transcriptional regulator [Gaiellales bacterium]
MSSGRRGRRGWRYLTNHGAVALVIASDPHVRMTDIAARTGLSRRAVQMIITDLAEAGHITRRRVGRRNAYTVNEITPPAGNGASDVEPTLPQLVGLLGNGARAGARSRLADVSWASNRN